MKKTPKKLSLNRETVRNLETSGLQDVRAGYPGFPPLSHTASGEDCCITTH
jgi:hypothetical protein